MPRRTKQQACETYATLWTPWRDGREWFDERLDEWLKVLDEIQPPASARHQHAVYQKVHELYLVQQRHLARERKRNGCIRYGTEDHRDPTREFSCWSELTNHWPAAPSVEAGQLHALIIRVQTWERFAE